MIATVVVFLVFSVSLSVAAPAQGSALVDGCPAGWAKFEANCYLHVKQNLSRQKADNFCVDSHFHGNLVSIHSAEQNEFVKSLSGGDASWIGGAVDSDEKLFWTDNSPWNFNDFVNPIHPEGDHCIYVQGKWLFLNCLEQLPFICEVPAVQNK